MAEGDHEAFLKDVVRRPAEAPALQRVTLPECQRQCRRPAHHIGYPVLLLTLQLLLPECTSG